MKTIFLIIGFLSCLFCSHAQQKEKQIKRMLEQIAANKVYIDYLEKGYSIARNGLQTIQNIKKGDFNLHFNFFDSLKKVNPKIKTWTKVADIIAYQIRIIKDTKQTIKDIKEAHQFTDNELDYCKAVFDNLLEECLKNIDDLVTIITDGGVEMKDDERMKRIDRLYADMQDKYSFTSSFSNEMGILSAERLSEQVEINMSKKINAVQ